MTAEEVVRFQKMQSTERRHTLNTREMVMHEHWPVSENVPFFMDFDKTIASTAETEAELRYNERVVAQVMYMAYGAASGLCVDCLYGYQATLEIDTFSESSAERSVVYECECKLCTSFELPVVRIFTSHRKARDNRSTKCSIHAVVQGERHCTNTRHVTCAIMASIQLL